MPNWVVDVLSRTENFSFDRVRESLRRHAEPRFAEYWEWLAVALFLLITVDLLTSLYAASVVGVSAEANPLMRWLLAQSIATIVAVHIAITVAVTLCFAGVLIALARTPAPFDRYLALVVEAWLACLIAAGLFVFANNLSVIVHGVSLF